MRRCRARSLFRPLSEVHLGAGDRPFCHEGRLGEAVRGGKSRLRQGMRLPFRSRSKSRSFKQTSDCDQRSAGLLYWGVLFVTAVVRQQRDS